jgi:uncharacterized Zn finger protein (UPF0148 family)
MRRTARSWGEPNGETAWAHAQLSPCKVPGVSGWFLRPNRPKLAALPIGETMDHPPDSITPPDFPELARVLVASQRLTELEERHLQEKAEALAELQSAARSLQDIPGGHDRSSAVAFAATHSRAKKNDLAWVLFKKEHQEYHLRKFLAGRYRDCQRCGTASIAGTQFEAGEFYCPSCWTSVQTERQRRFDESDRRADAKRRAREERIAELKAKANLGDSDANELASLIISQADGPLSQLTDFIAESLARGTGSP